MDAIVIQTPELAANPGVIVRDDGMIRVIENINPLDRTQRRVQTLPWLAVETVAEAVDRAGMDAAQYIVSQNGVVLSAEELQRVFVVRNASLVCLPVAMGGALKGALGQIVMFAAVLAVAGAIFVFTPASFGLSLAIAQIGGAIVSFTLAMLAPGVQSPSFSMTYDPTGPKSLAQAGTPLPKAYGTMGWGGNCISSYVQYAGQKGFIYALYCYGFGKASSISNILLNGKAISTYENTNYFIRYGTNGDSVASIGTTFYSCTGSTPPTITISITGNGTGASASVTWLEAGGVWGPTLNIVGGSGYTTAQATVTIVSNGASGYVSGTNTYNCSMGQTAIDGFQRTVNGWPQETELLVSAGPVIVPGTGTDVQGLDVTMKFPSGLYHISAHGNYVPIRISYKLEVSPHGTNTWSTPLFPRWVEPIFKQGQAGELFWPQWVCLPTDRFRGTGICYAFDDGPHNPGDKATFVENVDVYDWEGNETTEQATFQGEWQPCDPNLGFQQVTGWWGGYRVLKDSIQNAFFDTVSIYGLSPGQWDVRATKIGYQEPGQSWVTADSTDSHYVTDIWLWNVNEITLSDLAYPNMVLIGVNALASGQLNGTNLQLTATITHTLGEDTVLPAQLAGFETDNPALVAYDVLTNPLYGMAVPASQIDIPAFVDWAEFCDESVTNQDGSTARRFVFAGVFDQKGDAWKTLQMIGNMSRATVIQSGMRYTVAIDAPGEPVQIFTVGNMTRDSFTETWVSLDDRAVVMECTFADAARNWRTDLPVTVMTSAAINNPVGAKTVRTQLLGCTSRDQAYRWAYFHLLSTQLCLRSVDFRVNVEALACEIGSLIGVQTDVTQWGTGGRILAGSTLETLVVDRDDLTFTAGAGYTVAVSHPVVQRGTATVSAVSGTTLTMTANLPAGRIVKAVDAAGNEYIVNGYTANTITVDTLQPLASTVPPVSGTVLTLYDQNVIDTVLVTGWTPGVGNGTLSIASNSFSAIPTADSAWVYGQSSGSMPAKLFRVLSIRRSGDLEVEIKAIEYNPLLYVDPVPNYGTPIGIPNTDATVSDLTLTEVFQQGLATGNLESATIGVSWVNGNKSVGGLVRMRVQPVDGLQNDLMNLLPDTDLQNGATYWGDQYPVNSFWEIQYNKTLADNAFTFTNGTGAAYTVPAAPSSDRCYPVPVIGGQQYTLSAYFDVSQVTGTGTGLYVWDAATGAQVAYLTPAGGSAPGRYNVTFTVPAATSAVVLDPFLGTATIAAGASVVIAQPMLQSGAAMTDYLPGGVPTAPGESGWQVIDYVANGNSTSFVGTIGVTYAVEVTGIDAAGNQGSTPAIASIAVLANTNAPPAPATVSCAQVGNTNVLSWSAVAGASSYQVYYRDTTDFFALSKPALLYSGTALTWTDTQVRTGVYMIFAVGPLPAQIQSAPAYASNTPVAPTGLTVTDDTSTATVLANGTSVGRALVQWTPPLDSDVTSEGKIQIQYQFYQGSTTQPVSPLPMVQLGSGAWQSDWIDAGEASGNASLFYITGIDAWESFLVQIRSVRANGNCSAWVVASAPHPVNRPQPIISLGGTGVAEIQYPDGTVIQSLQPAQAGADVTAQHTSALTASLSNQTSDALASGSQTTIPYRVAIPGEGSTASTWMNLGTWVFASPGSLKIEVHAGTGYNTNGNQQAIVDVIVRTSNGAAAPNISGVSVFTQGGTTPVLQAAAVATGGSTAPGNNSWEIMLNLAEFANGFALVYLNDGDTFTYSGAINQTAPVAGSTAVLSNLGTLLADHNSNVQNLGGVGFGSLINPAAGGTGLDFILDGGSFRRVGVGAFNGSSSDQFQHSAMSTEVQSVINTSSELIETTTISGGLVLSDLNSRVSTAIESTGNVTNLGGVAAASITPISNLMPAQAGADVTAQHTSALTASLSNQTSDALASGSQTTIPYRVAIPGEGSAASTWMNLGTWVFASPGSLKIEVHSGAGYNTNSNHQAIVDVIVRTSNGGGAPNISGVSVFTQGGSTPVLQAAAVATGGSTAANNNSWEIMLNMAEYANGFALVYLNDGDTFTYSGAINQTAPVAGSTAVLSNTSSRIADANSNLLLKNIAAVPGVTQNPPLSSAWADLPELGTSNPAMTFTTFGNPILIASELLFTAVPSGGSVNGIGTSFPATSGSTPPSISISISGDGTGASASVNWNQSGGNWYPGLTLVGGSGYTSATATVTITSNSNPGYTSGTTTYNCTITSSATTSGVQLSARILMDGAVVAGPYPLTTDLSGNAIFTGTQLVTPTPPAGSHSFEVQAMTTSGLTIYSSSRSFQLVELG